MPVNKDRTVLKTVLLAPVAPIAAWAVQQISDGDPIAGVVALVFGMLMASAYVVIQEYDIPYEDRILGVAEGVAGDTSEQAVEEAVEEASEEAADSLDGD